MGYTPAQLAEARAFDAEMRRDLKREPTRFKEGRLKRRLSLPAFFNTYRDCPMGTSPGERERYIQDNERLYLDDNSQKTPAGLVNRHGRVRERTIYCEDGTKRTQRT